MQIEFPFAFAIHQSTFQYQVKARRGKPKFDQLVLCGVKGLPMLHDEMKKIKFGGPGFEVHCDLVNHVGVYICLSSDFYYIVRH